MTKVRSILCPTDFSPPAVQAIDCAIEVARTHGARLVLLHVVPPSSYPLRNLASISGFPNLRDEMRKCIDNDLVELQKRIPDEIQTVTAVVEGVPHDQILAAAEQHGCDLIVMATHGHTGLKHAFLGSTTERVVRLATCPVLTLRTGTN